MPSSNVEPDLDKKIPAIKITHVYDERRIFLSKSSVTLSRDIMDKSAGKAIHQLPQMADNKPTAKIGACLQCNTTGNRRVNCADICSSLTLPLELELNVLGIVDQGMIDRGDVAKNRRKRNSAPDIFVEELRNEVQKLRPRSLTTIKYPPLPSTTLCSTEL